jgi:ankyrin repeat protein
MSIRSEQDQTKKKKLVGKELDESIRKVVTGGNVNELRELLDTYDDVTERQLNDIGRKALHVAADVGDFDVAKVLIQNGADVNAVDKDNWTSLHIAAGNGNVDVAKLLIQNGADVNAEERYYCTSLHIAAGNGNVDVAKLLIQNGAEVNAVDEAKRTSLHLVADYGHVDVAKLLIQNGADVNAVDEWKWSVLCYASCRSKSVPITLELLCSGAKIDKTTLKEDNTGLLVQIENKLEKLRNGDHRIMNLCSNEENKYKWYLAFCLTIKAKIPAFKVYYKVCSFITFNGIFMAPGYDLGKKSIWRK